MTILAEYDPQTRLADYDPAHLLVEQIPDLPVPNRSSREREIAEDLIKAFLAAIAVVKVADWLGFIKIVTDKGWDDQAYEDHIGSVFKNSFGPRAMLFMAAAADLGRRDAHKDHFGRRTDSYGPGVAPWAKAYADVAVAQIEAQSKRAIQESVNDLLNRRMSAPALADMVSKMYGLDPRDAKAYANYVTNKQLPRGKSLPEMLTEMVQRRAKVIGETETFTAMNFGRQLLYLEAMAEGRMPSSARKVWVTALDERVCKICRPMDGVSVRMGDPYEIVLPRPKTSRGKVRPNVRLMVPPVHPNCRCTVVPQEAFLRGMITRTARFKDLKDHRAELVSRAEDLIFKGGRYGLAWWNFEPRDITGQWASEHAQEVRRRRTLAGLSVDELGREAGVSGDMIRSIETGKRNPSSKVFTSIQQRLDLSHPDFAHLPDTVRNGVSTEEWMGSEGLRAAMQELGLTNRAVSKLTQGHVSDGMVNLVRNDHRKPDHNVRAWLHHAIEVARAEKGIAKAYGIPSPLSPRTLRPQQPQQPHAPQQRSGFHLQHPVRDMAIGAAAGAVALEQFTPLRTLAPAYKVIGKAAEAPRLLQAARVQTPFGAIRNGVGFQYKASARGLHLGSPEAVKFSGQEGNYARGLFLGKKPPGLQTPDTGVDYAHYANLLNNRAGQVGRGGLQGAKAQFEAAQSDPFMAKLHHSIRKYTGSFDEVKSFHQHLENGVGPHPEYDRLLNVAAAAPHVGQPVYRGMAVGNEDLAKFTQVGSEFNMAPSSFTGEEGAAHLYANRSAGKGPPGAALGVKTQPHRVVVRVKDAHGLHIGHIAAPQQAAVQNEWLVGGKFKVTGHVHQGGVHYVDVSHVGQIVPRMGQPFQKRFNPSQIRDRTGRWAKEAGSEALHHPVETVGTAALAGELAYFATRPTSSKAAAAMRLTESYKRHDRMVAQIPHGEVRNVPIHYLNANQNRISFRLDQEGHIRDLARHMGENKGFLQENPIVIHRYRNKAIIRDGNHRLLAANMLGLEKVPTRVYHFDQDYVPHGNRLLQEINIRREAVAVDRNLKRRYPLLRNERGGSKMLRQVRRALNDRLILQDARNRPNDLPV